MKSGISCSLEQGKRLRASKLGYEMGFQVIALLRMSRRINIENTGLHNQFDVYGGLYFVVRHMT